MAKKSTREYIGDGVYVTYRYGDLTLETDRSGVTHWIVLEPQVYAALVAHVAAQRDRAGDANRPSLPKQSA